MLHHALRSTPNTWHDSNAINSFPGDGLYIDHPETNLLRAERCACPFWPPFLRSQIRNSDVVDIHVRRNHSGAIAFVLRCRYANPHIFFRRETRSYTTEKNMGVRITASEHESDCACFGGNVLNGFRNLYIFKNCSLHRPIAETSLAPPARSRKIIKGRPPFDPLSIILGSGCVTTCPESC